VDVRLDLPGRSDLSSVLLAGQSNYAKLLESGVSIYERRGPDLHAKTAVIDGLWSTIGSTNLEHWSFVRDYELNAAILDARFGERMEKMFREDLRQSDEITLRAWKSRPFADRLLSWTAGLFSYWF
ncbi:MAG: phospholipase D-like domain-containing protein, partial [Syntrophorhabdales bacterium]